MHRRPLACMPRDRSGLPQLPELDDIVITDLYTLKQCEICRQDVWVGPRQMAAYEQDPGDYVIACYLDAIRFVAATTGQLPDPDSDVQHLGGGYPVEGRPRVT